ncbi:MAG TPA: serine/threonine-protein kinase [Gaiellaceae bacterium]|nr:serine/threonine-protein kinase [Gaiellaceae bacterium]
MSEQVEAPPPLPEGAQLARGYRVLRHLARGKALDVYDVWSDARYALCVAKAIRPDRLDDPGARRRLRREGRMLLQLTHPHIVRAYELVERPHPVLALEALTGATLDYLLETRARRFPATDVVYLGLQLCSAMSYAHTFGILHLDLKPANIISEGGIAKVIDFSVARPRGKARPGVGTRQYLSPEQARGGVLGPPADVWGIGAVLYATATGRRPFYGLDQDTKYPQLDTRAAPVATYRHLPRALAKAIDACLEPLADARPTTVELSRELEGLI